MANIETEKFNNIVLAIGSDTISAIATSGPEMQVCIVYVCICVCMLCVYALLHAHTHTRMCVHVWVHLYGTLHKNLCEHCEHKCEVFHVLMA